MGTKICSKCKKEKDFSEFMRRKDSKDGYRNECRECKKKIDKEYHEKTKEVRHEKAVLYYLKNKDYVKSKSKEYRDDHKEKYKDYMALYYIQNKDKIMENHKKYYHENKESIDLSKKAYMELHKEELKEWKRIYRQSHKKERNEREKRHIEENPSAKIAARLRSRITCVLRGNKKAYKLEYLLGCSVEFLREYLESLWSTDMSWSNYGKFGWHIDHIIPCAAFDLSDPKQQKQCFHYTNLQPLWWYENLSKNSIYNGRVYRYAVS